VQGILALVKLLEKHRVGVLACSRCFPEGGNAPVVDLPKRSKVLLVAQAPGSTEVATRLPFTGPAGKTLERWFARAGVSREEVYLSALARCFPGKARRRKAGGHGGDLAPSRAMIRSCRPHLWREFELLRPEVVVPVGGLAIRELLSVTRLSEAVGRTFERDRVVYVPLPHPSGASTWLNGSENQERLTTALATLGEQVAALRHGEKG
jgi:uracil-DNA glycosylase